MMKVTTVLFSLFILHVKGIFWDEFAEAISSVENEFSKLINDAVSDVQNTVHCTILAMEQVLAMSGVESDPSTYNCYPHSELVDNIYSLPMDNLKTTTEIDNRNIYSERDIAQQIHSSISNVNKTLMNILGNDGHDSLRHVKRVLKNEADRLTEVSHLLRQELEKISYKLRNQFQHIDSDRPSLESLWEDMRLLHNVEENDKNVTEVEEISTVLNEALNVLHVNASNAGKSDEEKIETIMQQLEQESNNNGVAYNNIEDELGQWKDKRAKLQTYSDDAPKTFEDVASNILKDKENIQKEIEQSQAEGDSTLNDKESSADLDYYSLFDAPSKEEHKNLLDQAKNIIEDSAHTEQVLNAFFAEQQNSAVDVF